MSYERKKSPSFEGNEMPTDINLTNDDDIGEETTRRIGAPANFDFGQTSVMPPQAAMPAPHLESRLQQKIAPGGPIAASSPALSTTSAWQLRTVPTLPEYHPLERTAVFVPHTNPTQVSGRISDVLRDRSIEAVYDDDKAKVKCVTPDGVDFRIRLYRGRGVSYDHGIIVEVQRRFGSSTNFYRETMSILDAAEGKAVPPPPPSAFGPSGGSSLPMVSDSEDDFSSSSYYSPNGSSSLEMVAKMFQHNGYDSHYLAYQTLLPLTDPSKMGLATARAVSSELLKSGNVVGDKVLNLVLSRNDEDDMFKLRTMAMTVLANAISAVKGKVDLDLREELRPVLIKELYKSDKNPRSAQMAALCVEHLIQDDHDAAEFHDALAKAIEVGTARHAGLQRQAKRSMDKIQ